MFKLAIASGKGGTGKTFVSTNLYHTLVQQGVNVALTDCDAEEPNAVSFFNVNEIERKSVTQKVPVIDSSICTYCGKCQKWCMYNAILILKEREKTKVVEEMCHGCGACVVACEYGAITEKDMVLGEVIKFSDGDSCKITEGRLKVGVYTPVPVLKSAIKSTSANLVIFDSPPGTSCPFIHTVNSSDYVVLVTEPTPFGLNDLKLSVEILRQMDKPFSVIINRAGLGNREVYDFLERENIDLIMEIPFDKEIASVYSKGELVVLGRTVIAAKFSSLARILIDKTGGKIS